MNAKTGLTLKLYITTAELILKETLPDCFDKVDKYADQNNIEIHMSIYDIDSTPIQEWNNLIKAIRNNLSYEYQFYNRCNDIVRVIHYDHRFYYETALGIQGKTSVSFDIEKYADQMVEHIEAIIEWIGLTTSERYRIQTEKNNYNNYI